VREHFAMKDARVLPSSSCVLPRFQMTLNEQVLTTPDPSLIAFARGVIAILSAWPVLRLAVEQGWGGPESVAKRRWLSSVIVDAFADASPPPDAAYVEEMLLQALDDEFEVVVDDESATTVARDVVLLWNAVQSGAGAEAVATLETRAEQVRGKRLVAQAALSAPGEEWEEEMGDDDDDDEGEGEAPQLVPSTSSRSAEDSIVDDEGFTVITKGSKAPR